MSEPYLPLYIGDYLRDTGYLTLEQHGAYFLMLMRLWSAGGNLPADEAKLARIAGVSVKKWRPIWADLATFFEEDDGHISHKRITAELEKAGALRAKRAAAGAKGGAAKSLKDKEPPLANATAKPKQIIPESEIEKEEPSGSSKKNACRIPDDFEPDLSFAVSEGLTASQAEVEAAKFRDYWISKAGKDASKKDWPATWRNWVRNASDRLPRARGSPQKPLRGSDFFYAAADGMENGSITLSDSDQGNWDDAPRIPQRAIGHHG